MKNCFHERSFLKLRIALDSILEIVERFEMTQNRRFGVAVQRGVVLRVILFSRPQLHFEEVSTLQQRHRDGCEILGGIEKYRQKTCC